jgi:hypothetical protein
MQAIPPGRAAICDNCISDGTLGRAIAAAVPLRAGSTITDWIRRGRRPAAAIEILNSRLDALFTAIREQSHERLRERISG